MKFTNWKSPSVKQLLKEYKIEHDMKGNKFWQGKREFLDAVKNAKVERITKEADQAIAYRSGTQDKGQLLSLIKGYRSYPKYRNESTINAIYDGYAKNAPMDRPLVVDFGKEGRRVFSGNTRMDAAYHSGVDPEVLVVKGRKFSAKLTEGARIMKLKEFRYYPYPGNPYENPYDKDFLKDRDKDRKHGLIKAGLIGAGLIGGGALVGRGLFKSGISAAARRADDLEGELMKLRSAKSSDVVPPPKPRGRPKAEVIPHSTPPPPSTPPPTPPPNTPPLQPPPSNADKEIITQGKKKKSVAAKVQTVENLQNSGAITNADAAAEVEETLAAAPKKTSSRKKTSTEATPEVSPEVKKAIKRTARRKNSGFDINAYMEEKKAQNAEILKRAKGASTAAVSPKGGKAGGKKKGAGGKKKGAGGKKKVVEASVPHEIYKGHKVFTDADYLKKWGSVEAQKKIIDQATGLTARLRGLKEFNFQTDEGGIPFTGKVAKDRFIKKLRDEDLDRRDANILRAGAAGSLAGLLLKGKLSAGKRALIGAGLGGAGVVATRMATNNTRDIYGERSRGAKRAELAPALAGLGAAGYFASRRLRGLSARLRGVKEFGIVSVGTAKKVLGGLRQGGKPNFLRPAGIPEMSMYIPKGTPLETRAQVSAGFAGFDAQGKNVSINPHTVIVPRESKAEAGWFDGPRPLSDSIAVGLHEHGHAADPILARYGHAMAKRAERFQSTIASGNMGAADRLGQGLGRVRLRGERRANQNVLKQIQAHGTDKEATAWKQWANKQMKQGYRNPMYQSAVAGLEADTLTKKKAILREAPFLRSKFTNLAARLEALSLKRFSRLRAVKFFEKKKEKKSGGLNPYVGAALSGFGSGAALGSLALLRRGATFRGAAKTAGKLGLASAGIVGGGALLGSKIIGNPRDNESAPFTKRAAIGGAIVGSGAGLAGALLLRKTKGGAKALVSASKKTEPFSRPAMWLRKTPLVGAAGIGAVGGALYGGGMGADEGQQVDSIRNIKKDLKKNLSAKLRSVNFFGSREQARWDGGEHDSAYANTAWGWATDRPMYVAARDKQGRILRDVEGNSLRKKWDPSSGQLWNSVAREAQKQRVIVQRGGRLSRDVVDELRGAERRRDASGRIKKREWEKSWFQNKATEIGMAAAGVGGLAAVRYANNNPDTKVGQAWINAQKSANATQKNLRDIGGGVLKAVTNITARRRAFASKFKKVKELDAIAEYEGWDVRDPRGRSARVFAPGSRRRERRQKEWHEKTDNERKLWKAGLVASALGGAGVLLVGQRLASGKSLIPSRFVPKQPNPDVFVEATKMFRPGAA